MSKTHLYIATAIPYVNGAPHIGNAMDYLLADIWTRYQMQQGHAVRFSAGTDEHGNKNAQTALKQGLTPQAFADQQSAKYLELIQKMKASYTDFIRTTNPEHTRAVQYIWQRLKSHIYKGSYEGWYCQGCESFVTDKEATTNEGICPDHKTPYQRVKEDNYFLKMSDFIPQIKAAIESDKLKIVPAAKKKEFLSLIAAGMPDVSISRPKKSLSWGVVVPDDPDQVMYVWLDALSNYITVLGYPENESWKDFWPADVQVLGKDILRFHAGIWPAILLGLNLPLPKTLLVHGFVLAGGAKMSKTVGNVVDPNALIDKYGLDAFRYYFSRHIPTLDDGDFTYEKFENAYNNELANDLGNLVSRTATMINNYQSGVVGDIPAPKHDMFYYHTAIKEFRFSDAITDAWSLLQGLNRYIDETKPWEIAKTVKDDAEAEEHLGEVLSRIVGTIMQANTMLEPFLPDATAKVKQIFGTGVVKMPDKVLFPKIITKTEPSVPPAASAPTSAPTPPSS
ncbi:methionine--tRNA ligase [Candidatus Saccharibacteria bacterium]|nr:methionine--tRNA ligase [Candidatus Saccharibacteria bacterium]